MLTFELPRGIDLRQYYCCTMGIACIEPQSNPCKLNFFIIFSTAVNEPPNRNYFESRLNIE